MLQTLKKMIKVFPKVWWKTFSQDFSQRLKAWLYEENLNVSHQDIWNDRQ